MWLTYRIVKETAQLINHSITTIPQPSINFKHLTDRTKWPTLKQIVKESVKNGYQHQNALTTVTSLIPTTVPKVLPHNPEPTKGTIGNVQWVVQEWGVIGNDGINL